LTGDKFTTFVNEKLIPARVKGDAATVAKIMFKTYHLKLPVCKQTCLHWMHEIGCVFEQKSQTYMTDGHEKPEYVLDRNEYTLRDQGSVGDPAARELAQYNWIQVTSEKANEVFAALRVKSPEAEEALRKSAYFFVSPSDAIPVDKNGIVCFTEGESHCTYVPKGSTLVEFHLESTVIFDEWRNDVFLGGNLSVRMPVLTKALIVLGQDEASFNSESAPKM
jgi:hypothetical protein